MIDLLVSISSNTRRKKAGRSSVTPASLPGTEEPEELFSKWYDAKQTR